MQFTITDINGAKHDFDTNGQWNAVLNADCMTALKQMPDKCVELAICDPPYGIGVGQMKMGSRHTVAPDKTKTWDNSTPSNKYFEELQRVSVNRIIWGGNYFGLPATRGFVVWDKGETLYGRSFAECEYAWTSFDVSARIYKKSPNDVTRIHPTQKPVHLYQWLLRNYAKPGDKILDTHMGSGSSIIACHDMGFEYMAFEIDKDYYDAACKRIEEHKAQVRMVFEQ